MKPPVAKQVHHAEVRHGEQRVDPYFWLRERDNPEVVEYLKAENAYTEAMTKHTEKLRTKLYDEMLGRIKQTDLEVPERIGKYHYYTRTEEGKQYKYYCRKTRSLDADEELLLDHNALAAGLEYCRIGVFEVSPDHTLLAYSVDTTGAERFTLRIKDLRTGELLPDEISNTYSSMEWANDNSTLFYNTLDEAHRPYRLQRHVLGTDPAKDVIVHQEDDDAYFLDVLKTRDHKYLLLHLESNNTSEVRYLDASEPMGEFRVIHPRQHEMEYSVEHLGGRFYILTNDDALNFKLVQAPTSDPSKPNWQEMIPHRRAVKLDSVDAFAGHLVVLEKERGLRRLRVIGLPGGGEHFVDFPEPVYSVWLGKNPEFDTPLVRFTYTSLVTPESIFDYDMNTKQRELKKQKEVLGGYDRDGYVSERLYATASDGTEVPISLVHKQGVRDGRSPLLLYGYGSYGSSANPRFSSNLLSLLDRGVIYAIAHVRGGGYLGRPWYEDGKLFQKRNTFTDFIACAEHLIAKKYTSPDRMAIRGRSAGGLLMGAVTNMRPDLFAVVVAEVPFVDVMNTMLDPSIPLTVIEWEEWGDPRRKDYYDYMMSYSPYDSVEEKEYPDMLITTGLNDPRVQYWEPAKWTAKLRTMNQSDNAILLKTDLDIGHGGSSGRYDKLEEKAFNYAFILDRLGIE